MTSNNVSKLNCGIVWTFGGREFITNLKRLYLYSKNGVTLNCVNNVRTDIKTSPEELYDFLCSPEMRRYVCETTPNMISKINKLIDEEEKEIQRKKMKRVLRQLVGEVHLRQIFQNFKNNLFSGTRQEAKAKLKDCSAHVLRNLGHTLYPKQLIFRRGSHPKVQLVKTLLDLEFGNNINLPRKRYRFAHLE